MNPTPSRHGCTSWSFWRLRSASPMAAAVVFLALTLPVPAAVAQAATAGMAAAAQSSTADGVTVKVTPVSSGIAGQLEFSVVFDTHNAELNDDLLQTATLTTADGRKIKPVRWSGAAAGGHHREGVLSFDIAEPRGGDVELAIARPGESAPRVFRWPR